MKFTIALSISAVLALSCGNAHELTGDAGTIDQRIAYYTARLGGAASYPAYARLGFALLDKQAETGQLRFHGEAMSRFQASHAFQPNPDALLGLALGWARVHQFPKALKHAMDANSASPGMPEILGALFDIQLALGESDAATSTLTRLRLVEPGFGSLTREAALLEYQGDLQAAIDAFRRATNAIVPHHSKSQLTWSQLRLGSLLAAHRDAAAARRCYDAALQLAPDSTFAHERVAAWLAAAGQWKSAHDAYVALLKRRPDPAFRLAAAHALRQLGKQDRAADQERRAIEELQERLAEGCEDSLRTLALALLDNPDPKKWPEGLRLASRDAELRNDVFTRDALAWACWRNGRTNDALRISQETLRSGNRRPLLKLHCGIMLTQTGQTAKGHAMLKQALQDRAAMDYPELRLVPWAERELSKPIRAAAN